MEIETTDTESIAPNHHAHHRGFSGVPGALAALAMSLGRGRHARVLAELAQVERGDVVVDVGCGPGAFTRRAASLGATAIGVDPAPVMLRVARLLGTRGGAIRYVEGTAEALPLEDATATVLWSVATVHHWRDVDAGISEAHRVLRSGGRLLAAERRVARGATGLASHGWFDAQAEAFANRCRAAGFMDVTVEQVDIGRRGPALVVRAVRP